MYICVEFAYIQKQKKIIFMKKFDYQGKRKDQVQFSENMVVYGIIGILFILCLVVTINILNKI